MIKLFRAIIFVSIFTSCVNKPIITDQENFSSRIYYSSVQKQETIDYVKTDLRMHLKKFDSINWEYGFWQEFNSKRFEFPNLEVIDKDNSVYFTVTVFPNDSGGYLFEVGFGTQHENNGNSTVKKKIRLFSTGSDKEFIPIKLMKLFFQRKHDEIEVELRKLEFIGEVDDDY